MNQFDCSEVFPHYKRADCVVLGNSARIRLYFNETAPDPETRILGEKHFHLDMDVDKLANFLEQCRRQQDPTIYHLT
jgi:hypothetical protein